MAYRPTLNYSKTRIRKAGKALRSMWDGEELWGPDHDEHRLVMENWRSCHAYPLLKAYMGLLSRVRTCGIDEANVTQRLKRQPTIIDKLSREPSMGLDRMQDIAGVRAVVPDMRSVKAVQRRYTGAKKPVRTIDYVSNPKPNGYRATHLVVEYDGFPVEVQLRTEIQHMWAEDVENIGGAYGFDLKSNRGPEEVLAYLALAAEVMAAEERGDHVDDDLAAEVRYARNQAILVLDRGPVRRTDEEPS